MEKIKKILNWLKSQPTWIRLVAVFLIAAAFVVFSFSSCGPTVRVHARSTSDTVSISISQNVTDSTGVSVSVNPNININPLR